MWSDDLAELLSMIPEQQYPVEPWSVRETRLEPRRWWRRPSRCSRCPTGTSDCGATSTRANRTACRAPTSTRSTRLRPLPYAEAGYGYPESGQAIVNVTNGKLMRLLVDDEPFDVRYGATAVAPT